MSANAISPGGKIIVGSSEDLGRGSEGFAWTPENGMVGLGGLQGISSVPSAISSGSGLIVGISETTEGVKPFRLTFGEGMQPLPRVPRGLQAEVYGVSSDGSVVVGRAWLTGSQRTRGWASRWTEPEGFVNLESSRDDDYYAGSTAAAVSADGRIVVGDNVFGGRRQAFRWTKDGGMVALGILPGEKYSEALAVSADGRVVVGQSGSRPFIWDERHGMRDLRKALESDYGLGEGLSGWQLNALNGMSADGTVLVGRGVNPSGGPEGWVINLRSASAR
jgi:probable HAF family extracellular repeat protein